MRDGCREAKLGDLFEPSKARLGRHDSEPIVFSVSKHDGVMPADEFFGKRVASAKLDDYKLLPDDAWVYSTIHIDEGSIARNTTGVDGVVSPMYTVMRWISEMDDPSYAELLLRSAEMLAVYSDSAQGSINRRRSLPWRAFSALTVTLPPLDEQRRIVELIAAVDDVIDAAVAERSAAETLLVAEREVTVRRPSNILHKFGDLVSRVRVPVDVDPTMEYAEIGLRSHGKGAFLKAPTNGDALGAKKVFWIAPGDLVFSIVFAWEGAVAVLGDEVAGRIASHRFPTFRGEKDWIAEYLFHYFRSAIGANALVQFSPGGAGRNKTLNVGRLLESQIPVPSDEDALALMGALRSTSEALSAVQTTIDALRSLRTNLLTVLLSGEHEIPSSYDALLEEVA